MTPKLEFLQKLEILGDIRMRHGAQSPKDSSQDYKIELLSNLELIGDYCTFHFGKSVYWYRMLNYYNDLNNFDKQNEK